MKRKMTDLEIFNMLYEIEPESMEQENKIKAMMRIILSSKDKNLMEFLKTLTIEDILFRPTKEVYMKYCTWADDNKYERIAHNVFSEAIQNTFYVKSKVMRVDGKSTRVYKSIY